MISPNTLIVIPARYNSSRLPGKPLLDIGGLPMIVRTYRNVLAQAGQACVLVATDDDRIGAACKRYSVRCVKTSDGCRTGTDRVAEVAAGRPAYDVVLNVQGDEPFMAAGCVDIIVAAVKASGRVCCGMAPLAPEDVTNPNVGKVVCDRDGRALYISRSLVPSTFAAQPDGWDTQVCIYGFPRAYLAAFAAMPTGRLEAVEGIELLRWLEAGYPLQMVRVLGERLAVDTPADLERVRARVAGGI